MKKRFTEEQIIRILGEAEAGTKVKEVCRKHGISDATYYNWKAKYGGMTVSEAKRLETLEDENRRHSSLGFFTPKEFAQNEEKKLSKYSNLELSTK